MNHLNNQNSLQILLGIRVEKCNIIPSIFGLYHGFFQENCSILRVFLWVYNNNKKVFYGGWFIILSAF